MTKEELETDYKDLSIRLYKRVSELEKENAELKEKIKHRNCLDCSNHSSKLRMKTLELEKECTKAKEIIKGLKAHLDLSDCVNNDYRLQLLKQAEQFLNSEVEK